MLRTYFGLSLLISCILISSGWAITNGDFEYGDLTGWSTDAGGSGIASADYGTGHTGDYCAKLFLGGVGSWVAIDQTESVANEGEIWKVEGWCYKTGGTCLFGWYDGAEQTVSAGSWTKYTDTITFGSGDSKAVDFYLSGTVGSSAYLDDVVTSRIYESLNNHGTFESLSDITTYWMFEKYGDGTAAGNITWETSYAGQDGVARINQNSGEKGKITQVITVTSTGWYTATAKVATDISEQAKQQKVYLYLYEYDTSFNPAATGNLIIQPGKGGFGGSGVWRDLKISFYSSSTIIGVQVVAINPITTAVSGSLYIDNVFITAGASQPTGIVGINNASFDSTIGGWVLESYADATATGAGTWDWVSFYQGQNGVCYASQTSGQKGKMSEGANVTYAQHDAIGTIWVYSDATLQANTQKVYLYIYSYDNSGYSNIQESGNAILQPGKWTQGVWRPLKFGYSPLTNYNIIQFVGINPVGKPSQSIYFDEVSVKQD
ncbi:MAG: carbohydrate binding domain-containing protein [bacterium]